MVKYCVFALKKILIAKLLKHMGPVTELWELEETVTHSLLKYQAILFILSQLFYFCLDSFLCAKNQDSKKPPMLENELGNFVHTAIFNLLRYTLLTKRKRSHKLKFP